MECKQMYNSGLRVYCLDTYNLADFAVLSLYLSSYVLRFMVDHWIKQADKCFNGTSLARDALHNKDYTRFDEIKNKIFDKNTPWDSNKYFMTACEFALAALCHYHRVFCSLARFDWKPDDPEIVSDVLFAVANVLSIARTTYLMPAFEVLGPLQISLGRMLGDITRFLVLFTLVKKRSQILAHFMLQTVSGAVCLHGWVAQSLLVLWVSNVRYKC
jgi:hypothetical protein